jgi:hypothetical protein
MRWPAQTKMGDTPATDPPAKKRPPAAGTLHKASIRRKDGAVTALSPPPPPGAVTALLPRPPPPSLNAEVSVRLPPPPAPPPKARGSVFAQQPKWNSPPWRPKSPAPRTVGSSSSSSSTQAPVLPPPAFWRGKAAQERSGCSTRLDLLGKGVDYTAVTAVSEHQLSEDGAAADEEVSEAATEEADGEDMEDTAATAVSLFLQAEDPPAEVIEVPASAEYEDGLSPLPSSPHYGFSTTPDIVAEDDAPLPPPPPPPPRPRPLLPPPPPPPKRAFPKNTSSMKRRLRWKARFGDNEDLD